MVKISEDTIVAVLVTSNNDYPTTYIHKLNEKKVDYKIMGNIDENENLQFLVRRLLSSINPVKVKSELI